ncbi:MAG: hypothetical protein ACK55Z_25245, partial [bacterium]
MLHTWCARSSPVPKDSASQRPVEARSHSLSSSLASAAETARQHVAAPSRKATLNVVKAPSPRERRLIRFTPCAHVLAEG